MSEDKVSRKGKAGLIIRGVILAAGLAGCVALGILYQRGAADFDAKRMENDEKITSLTQELVSLTERTATAGDIDYGRVLVSAEDAGKAVAAAQNSYLRKDYLDGDVEDPMMVMSEYLADNTQNTKWGAMGPSYDGVSCEWRFDTVYAFGLERIPVLWTCWAGDELMASVTATYYRSSEKFGDFTLYETNASKDSQNETDNGPELDNYDPAEEYGYIGGDE